MVVLRPSVSQLIEIQELKKVISWVLWTPFVVSFLAVILFSLTRLMIHFFDENEIHLKRWSALRNRLAVITSAGEFVDVYSQQPVRQATSSNGVQREHSIQAEAATVIVMETQQSNPSESMINVTQDKDLFVADRRIPAQAKGSWYNIYLLLLPLQVAIISIVIVHKIYIEKNLTESCESFVDIADNFNVSRYYECRYHQRSESNSDILKNCNANDTDYGNDEIDCSIYSYNPTPSDIIMIILNSLLLHLTLAKGIVRFIIPMRYLVHKYGKTCREKCPGKAHGAAIIPTILVVILGIALIVYAIGADELLEFGYMANMVLFAFIVIATSVVLFQCGLFQSDLYTPFARCCFNVTDEPRPINDETTNLINNRPATENDQTSTRGNYEQIQ